MGYLVFALLLGLEFKTTRNLYLTIFYAVVLWCYGWFFYHLLKQAGWL
jgi:hypothetical protein